MDVVDSCRYTLVLVMTEPVLPLVLYAAVEHAPTTSASQVGARTTHRTRPHVAAGAPILRCVVDE